EPMARRSRLMALGQGIDPERAALYAARFAPAFPRETNAHGLATLLASAYPALGPALEAAPDIVRRIAAEGYLVARDVPVLRSRLGARVGDLTEPDRVRRELRRAARDERIRIALRELLPPALGGADVDVTARELAALADVTLEIALNEAIRAVSERFGPPRT